jgi:hypothetical protein
LFPYPPEVPSMLHKVWSFTLYGVMFCGTLVHMDIIKTVLWVFLMPTLKCFRIICTICILT